MKALLSYVSSALLVAGFGGWILASLVGSEASDAAWWAAGIALGVQILAFTGLLAVRQRRDSSLWIAIGAGALLRFGVVLVAALWFVRYAALDPAVFLLGLVGFLFVLLMMESALFRVGVRNK